MIATRIRPIENQGELGVPTGLTRLIRHEILLRYIRHIGGLIVLGQEVIIGLVFGRPNLFGNREPPFFRIVERGVDIKNDSAKRMNPVAYDFSDSKTSLSHILSFPLVSLDCPLSLAPSSKSFHGKSGQDHAEIPPGSRKANPRLRNLASVPPLDFAYCSTKEIPMNRKSIVLLLLIALLPALACAPRAMRGGAGTDNPNMDQPAMSTTLDRTDIEYLVSNNLDALYDSRFWKTDVSGSSQRPVFAIWPIENATSEHLEDQMLTLLSSIETSLVNSGLVQVVARSRQSELAREIGIQQGDIYDASRAARLGKQLGAKYFVTGKLTAVDERIQKTRRLQYTLFIQIIQIETGIVEFQNETMRSKALKG